MDTNTETHIFEKRKRDHIEWSLSSLSQTSLLGDFDSIELIHNSLPDLDFDEISLETDFLGHKVDSPFYVSAMTLGHDSSQILNHRLAEVCQAKKWPLFLGSQRRQLFDLNANKECEVLANKYPNCLIVGNLGLAQLIETSVDKISDLAKAANCVAFAIHLNPLQESIQSEGTPKFKGGENAIANLVSSLHIPVIVKETGSGMSEATIKKLLNLGVAAIDVSGLGGTHWGRIEGLREENKQGTLAQTAQVFANWGISTIQSVLNARAVGAFSSSCNTKIFASGGVRTGLDAAKLIALGASSVGIAQPFLKAALAGPLDILELTKNLEYQLKVAMFCTNSKKINDLKFENKWKQK